MEQKNIVRRNENMVSVYFESILDLMDYEPHGRNEREFKSFVNRDAYQSRSWIGNTNKNAGEVIDHALTGDNVLYESLSKKVRQMNSTLGMDEVDYVQKIKAVKRKLKHDRFGDELDIHKVYAGKLDTAWTRRERVVYDKEHPLVTLYVNISGSAGVEADESLWRAVVTLKIYEELIQAGKSVRVIVGGSSSGTFRTSHKCACAMVVKEYNQSLSMERLAAMTHIGFYRIFGFAAKAAQDELMLKSSMGYSDRINEKNIPINLQEEIAEGHTKMVFIERSTTEREAIRDLKNVYAQLKNLSGE